MDRDTRLAELGRRRDAEPRTDRSLAALTAALLAEVRETGLEKVSIAALCRRAGLHRTTFYGHYADVPALAADVFARIIDHYSSLDEHLPDGAADDARTLSHTYHAMLVSLMGHLIDERTTYRALLASTSGDRFRIRLLDVMRDRAAVAVHVYRVSGTDELSVAAVIGGAVFGAVIDLMERDSTDPRAAADGFFALMPPWIPRPFAQ